MKPIEYNYDHTVNVLRLVEDEEIAAQEGYASHLSGVPCHIQPLDESYSEDLEGSAGKEWLMFCDSMDIQEHDKIVDGATTYRVVGVENFSFLGETRHMELRLRHFLE